jgi:hypothetical protein
VRRDEVRRAANEAWLQVAVVGVARRHAAVGTVTAQDELIDRAARLVPNKTLAIAIPIRRSGDEVAQDKALRRRMVGAERPDDGLAHPAVLGRGDRIEQLATDEPRPSRVRRDAGRKRDWLELDRLHGGTGVKSGRMICVAL